MRIRYSILLLTAALGMDLSAAFVTLAEPRVRDMRPDSVRREDCDTLVVAKAIVNAKKVVKAVWKTTALGVYETYVNGVADEENAFKPGYTYVGKRRQESTWRMDRGLRTGPGETNVFAARVTSGWWRDRIAGWHCDIRDTAAFRGSLELTYADGTKDVFETDSSWKAAYAGQVVHADIYYGESIDARVSETFLTDPKVIAGWRDAAPCEASAGRIVPLEGARVVRRNDLALRPKSAYVWRGTENARGTNAFGRVVRLREFKPGDQIALDAGETLVVDFGQNASAVPEFRFAAAEGTRLTVNFGEMLNDANGERSRGNDGPAGSVYLANMRTCPSQLDYTFAGKGVESCRPSFSFWGYRYLTAKTTAPVLILSVRSVPVTSVGKAMERGALKTGNAAVNRLISNVRWGMLSNYLSIPTDCPQRDERQGWTADTQVFTRTALYCADVYSFLSKWMGDVIDSQLPDGTVKCAAPSLADWDQTIVGRSPKIGWSDAAVIVPWTCWRMSGDPAIVKENWDAMKRFVARIASDRYATPEGWFQFADWLSYEKWETFQDNARPEGAQWKTCPEYRTWWNFLGGCYLLWDARMMAEMSSVAAPSERNRYENLATETLAWLRKEFLTADGDLRECFRDLQSAHLFALKMGLAPNAEAKRKIRDRLLGLIRGNGNRLATGFLGTSILMETLSDEAEAPDVAYSLLLQHGNPSWLYSVDQGATTIWERWNGYTKEKGFGPVAMNSFNHYAYGAVLAWLYDTAAGIRPGPRGGFDEFELKPVPDRRLGLLEASFKVPRGEIRSAWKYEGDRCLWRFAIPKGTRAKVCANGVERWYEAGSYELELGQTTRLFVNADNDHWFRQRGPEKMTREAMVAYLDDIAQGGKVTDFVMCTMGQRASYDSKVCEPIWLGAGESGADRWVSNAKLCHERGLDVYRIWIDRCREKGIRPWISMRMNDVHGVTGKDWFRTCGFWRKHPELRRHPELDPLKGGGGWLNFTLDYVHKEVRDYHLAIFRELVDRYDADGYELDWMRWPCCFRVGHEKEDAHFLTEFMRECRAYANAAAAKRGRQIRLCVRVPQKLVCAEGFGLDPIDWAKEGLVDLIVPTCFIQAYDYELDFAGWAKAVAAVNPKVEVVPGGANMFSASDYGGTVPFELAAWRGWCDNMFVQGAKGVYLFNADYLEPAVRSEVYRKGVDPVQAANSPRRLLSSFDDITSVEGTLGQRCPFPSREGKNIVMSGGTAETVREVSVVLAMSEKGEAPQVELNGMKAMSEPTRIADCAPYCAKVAKDAWRWTFPREAFRMGPNEVKVRPNAAASDSNMTVWCEISLNTKEVLP